MFIYHINYVQNCEKYNMSALNITDNVLYKNKFIKTTVAAGRACLNYIKIGL
jgi:hypothetical protein